MPKTNRTAESIPIGARFNYWEVDKLGSKLDYLLCTCLGCGKTKEVNVYSLKSGKSKSCGCKSFDIAHETRKRRNETP